MDQKVVCMFLILIMLGISYGLKCYDFSGLEENFDATTATQQTCEDYEDVCMKRMYCIVKNLLCTKLQCIENPQFWLQEL